MLEIAYNLKSFKLFEGDTSVSTIAELFERVVAILAHRVLDRARKGLFQAYLTERDELLFVRGRIDIRESLKHAMHGQPYLDCEFQQLTHDLEDNQILLWTLYRVSRAGLQRAEVIQAVRQAYRVLSGVVKLTEKKVEHCLNRFYHRLNDDYRLLHGLCRLLLEHIGPDTKLGDRAFLPFQLDMPNLFELFVAEWLKQNALEKWDVAAHHSVKLKSNAELTFDIDLLLRDKELGRSIAVLDTKYKGITQPTSSDIQQVIAYAVEMGVDRAFLVYPGKNSPPITAQVGNIEVSCLSFDVSTNLALAGASFRPGPRFGAGKRMLPADPR